VWQETEDPIAVVESLVRFLMDPPAVSDSNLDSSISSNLDSTTTTNTTGTASTNQVTIDDLKAAVEEMRGYPEFQELENNSKGGEFNFVFIDDIQATSYYVPETNTIYLGLHIYNLEYKTVDAPDDWMDGYENATDEEYFTRMDSWPEYFTFTPQRVIFHEAFHSTQGRVSDRELLNPATTEQPAINATNDFMEKHYGEPGRLNHTASREIRDVYSD